MPIWVVGAWPRPKSMHRVLRCDGVVPQFSGEPDVPGLCLAEHGENRPYDVVAEGETPVDDPEAGAAEVARRAEAGCTWWLETRWETPHHSAERLRQVRERLAAGPPR